jgi:acetylornithine deacetylase/succinyl-diaminopimelate desuccinylase-like protein
MPAALRPGDRIEVPSGTSFFLRRGTGALRASRVIRSSIVCLSLLLAVVLPAGLAAGPAPASEDPAGWLAGYLRLDTTNPPGKEAAAARYLARILHRHGVPTRTFYTSDGRVSLYARLEGRRDDEGLLLLHHMDVVPAGEGWTREPFSGEVVEGEMWGRGAIDVKSLGIAHLAAFLDLAAAPGELERDVAFLAVADEESGGGRGTAWLLERHPELFDGVGAVYGEGGNNKVANGRLSWWGIETAQKRPFWLRATARGRAGHASGLNPSNAVHALVQGLDRVLALPRQWRVSDPVRRYLAALAPLHEGAWRERFSDPDAWIGPEGPRGPISPGQANLFLDSVQVTVLEAGERINVVPPVARAELDVRLLPDTDAEAFLARLREAAGPRLELEVLLASPPSPPTPLDHTAYRAAAEVLDGPVVPAFIAGFTDSRYLRARGIATYGVSPFLIEPQLLRGIHGPDERIPVAELERGVERMTAIVRRYATAPG